ncbi:hypothetical protein Barb4_02126 [Bacteroidales bacterium Barb4]|nr:hypothetical protein Barb4_02126 [Bacteroidales bacterium Barb4]
MSVAGRLSSGVRIAVIAGVRGLQIDNTFLQEYQSLCRLKGGAGGVSAHHRTVEKGFEGVYPQQVVVLSALATGQYVRVVVRGGHHAEDFSRFRLNHDDASHLVLHQQFAVGLQFNIHGEGEVVSGTGAFVMLAVVVLSFNSAVGITQ